MCGKAFELWQGRETTNCLAFLPTFMVELDIVLHGGLLAGSITEVCYLSSQFLPECDYVTFSYMLSQIHLSCVTFVHHTQGVEAFSNISSPLCTLAILCAKFNGDVPGAPLHRDVKHKRGSKI